MMTFSRIIKVVVLCALVNCSMPNQKAWGDTSSSEGESYIGGADYSIREALEIGNCLRLAGCQAYLAVEIAACLYDPTRLICAGLAALGVMGDWNECLRASEACGADVGRILFPTTQSQLPGACETDCSQCCQDLADSHTTTVTIVPGYDGGPSTTVINSDPEAWQQFYGRCYSNCVALPDYYQNQSQSTAQSGTDSGD